MGKTTFDWIPKPARLLPPEGGRSGPVNEIIREFLVESHEKLAQLDLDLITLEMDPQDHETLARVFRTIHNVKGTAGFLALNRLQAVTHAGENLLSRLRSADEFNYVCSLL